MPTTSVINKCDYMLNNNIHSPLSEITAVYWQLGSVLTINFNNKATFQCNTRVTKNHLIQPQPNLYELMIRVRVIILILWYHTHETLAYASILSTHAGSRGQLALCVWLWLVWLWFSLSCLETISISFVKFLILYIYIYAIHGRIERIEGG